MAKADGPTRELALTGCGTALVTPFRGGGVDRAGLARLVEEQIAGGTSFLVPCGTTGESPTLSDAEHLEVIETTVEAARGRVPVVAGTGTNDTHHAVASHEGGEEGGRRRLPDRWRRTTTSPRRKGSTATSAPWSTTGGLPGDALPHPRAQRDLDRRRDHGAAPPRPGGVLALKETGGVVDRVTRLQAQDERCPILSGDDGITLPMIALGAVGVISVASNVVPRTGGLHGGARPARGASRPALALHERLSPLFRALFVETNPIPVKAALLALGQIEDAAVRLPLTEATPATRALLLRALEPFRTQE